MQWLPETAARPLFSESQWDWIGDPASLTKKFSLMGPKAPKMILHFADWTQASLEQLQMLATPKNEKIWHRVISWQRDDIIWLTAEVLIPESSIPEEHYKTLTTDKTPIGKLLFADPSLVREPMLFSSKPPWARLSKLLFREKPLLLTETFSSDFFSHV